MRPSFVLAVLIACAPLGVSAQTAPGGVAAGTISGGTFNIGMSPAEQASPIT